MNKRKRFYTFLTKKQLICEELTRQGVLARGSSTRASQYFSFLTRKMKVSLHACIPSRFSHVQLFATLWTIAHQAPLSMDFSRQEYWSGLPCPPPGDLPDPGIETNVSYVSCTGFFTTSATWEAHSWSHPLLIPDLFLLILIPLGKCMLMSPVFLIIPVSS